MANKTMHHVVIGEDTYEIVDQYAREHGGVTIDTTLTQSGQAADAKATGDAIGGVNSRLDDVKEDLSTLNTEGTVPTSEQMLSENVTVDSVPYHFRKTASDNADREELEIVGGSVAWNQLAEVKDRSFTPYGVTVVTNAENGTIMISGTATESRYISIPVASLLADATPNHVVMLSASLVSGAYSDNMFWFGDSNNTFSVASPTIKKPSTISNKQLYIHIVSGTTYNAVITLMVQDLTAMFGSTIADYIYSLEQSQAGAGVAWFRNYFPKPYYEYNAGELMSVKALRHITRGFNAWDEETKIGTYHTYTGVFEADTTHLACKSPIPVVPNTTYYFNTNGYNTNVCYLDAEQNYIDNFNSVANVTKTTPSNCHYIVFNMAQAYGTTYNHDICINLSDPSRNGEYEPYKAHSYPLDDSLTLRGIPKLDAQNNLYYDGDTYESDGTVTRRYGIITLVGGSEAVYSSNGISSIASHCLVKIADKAFGQYNMVSDKFIAARTGQDFIGKMNGRDSTTGIEFILPLTVEATSDAVKAWFAENPTTVVYELATPTTEQADPYISPQICDPNGTEEFVSTGIVPVGHETRYPENLRAKIEGLPWDFSSLIAPTEKTTTASRNYTTGSLLIMGNVLYKVTANIANGGTITVGTNVTATTLAEVISALS